MLRWILILEMYGSDIDYIQSDKNIVADALSIFHINRNKETKQEFTFKKDIVSEINNTDIFTEI